MSRSRHTKPSKLVRKEELNNNQNSQVKKVSKPATRHVTPGKTLSPRKLKQLIQERDVKRKPDPKPPMPARSLLTRAGAARLSRDRTDILFQNPESLTCNGFTMALRRTSLSRRLSQPPVVIAKAKKVPPSKTLEKHHQCDNMTFDDKGEKHSENDLDPNQAFLTSPEMENLVSVQNASLNTGENKEAPQSGPQMVEDAKVSVPLCAAPVTEILSGPLEGTPSTAGLLFPEQTGGDVCSPPRLFAQAAACAPLAQVVLPEVTHQRNPGLQLEDLGSRVESLQLSDSCSDAMQSEPLYFPTPTFNMAVPELDLSNCVSIGGSVYPTNLIKLLLAGTLPDTLGSTLAPQEILQAPPDPGELPDTTSVLGQALSALPHPWGFSGAGVHGEVPVPPEVPGAIPVQGEVFGTMLNQQEIFGVAVAAPPSIPAFLAIPPNIITTYTIPPNWPESRNPTPYGLEVQGAMPILPLGSGHTPQSDSELSSIPPGIIPSNSEDEVQVCNASLLPANTQEFTFGPGSGLLQDPLGVSQLPQADPSNPGGESSQLSVTSSAGIVNTTEVSTSASLASATSSSSHTTLPTLEKKKRKRCGVCVPCQQKTNCGECTYCRNRKNSHQICKKRKCEELKKRPSLTLPQEADYNNKPVNGPKSGSMEYSRCGDGEEQRLDLNACPPENVTKNEDSMTGIEVERWTPSKKSHAPAQVKGDAIADVTEAERATASEDDRKHCRPPTVLAHSVRNGLKNAHCLPPETNLSFNKFNFEEFGKALGNHTYKFLRDTSNHKNAMSSVASGANCEPLKARGNVLAFQKSALKCRASEEPANPRNHPGAHCEGAQPRPPENTPSKETRDGSPVQPSLLSLMKDRRLTLEQVVAIEALTQLSEAPSENSSPSKSEKGEETDQRTASLLNSCKAILNSVRKDLQDPNLQQGDTQNLTQCPSLEKQIPHSNVVFNGQKTTSKSQSSATHQASKKPHQHLKVKNSASLLMSKPNSSKTESGKSMAGGKGPLGDCPRNSHNLSQTSNTPEYCNQLEDSSQNLNSENDQSCQDVPYSQIEEDVATQLTQLASMIKCNQTEMDDKNVKSTPTSLVTHNIQQKHSPEKGVTQQKPSVENNLARPKDTARKKAKSTPSRDGQRKKSKALSCQESGREKQEELSHHYSKLHDIWIAAKFQRFGQFGPHCFPFLFGKVPPFAKVLKPLTQRSTTLQQRKLFPPLSQIKFKRHHELAQEKMKGEPLDSIPIHQVPTESPGQVLTDNTDPSQVRSSVTASQKAEPVPQASSPPIQCATGIATSDQAPVLPDAEEYPAHHSSPASPGVPPETPLPVPASVLRNVSVVSSGGITVVSSKSEEEGCSSAVSTSELSVSEKAQKDFNDYAMNFLTRPAKNLVAATQDSEIPPCDCLDRGTQKDKGPYYTHLGAGPSVAAVRELMENRYGQKGKAVRIEKIVYTGKEAKSSQGCPVAKWVIRRSSKEEKVVCLVRERPGHHCQTAVIVVLIMLWEGIPLPMADRLYSELTESLKSYNGHPTDRRCTLNENRTCTCQGVNPETCGASFSFGCSWSMYFNGCKFGRSPRPRRFRIDPSSPIHTYYERITRGRNRKRRYMKPERVCPEHKAVEKNLEDNLQSLATELAPVYKQMAPVAYQNQVEYEHVARECRLGSKEGRPFSGVTACLDFCAHPHRDIHNMNNGSTVVCTLTREDNRSLGVVPDDEQLHVLPLYKLADTDEFGSVEGMEAKIKSGAIQVLKPTRQKKTRFTQPVPRCGKKRTSMMTEAPDRKIRALERQQLPRAKQRTSEANLNSSNHVALVPVPGSDNTKSYSSVPSTPHPVKEASPSPGFLPTAACSTNASPCRYNTTASSGFSERSGIPQCPAPSGGRSGAAAVAGECADPGRPGDAAPLPALSPPVPGPLGCAEPPPGPAGQPPCPEADQQQPAVLAAGSCPTEEEEGKQRRDAEEPLSEAPAPEGPESPCGERARIDEYWSDTEPVILDPSVGGVAIAPTHGSVLIECARRELHATTRVRSPNRNHPTRLSLVYYQHKNLNKPQHGFELNRIKYESKDYKAKKVKVSEQTDQAATEGAEASPEVNELNQIPSRVALTLTHDHVVTVSPYALTHVAGPYNHWV
uniref:methylcytosine dioxygenase TET1 isoform X2 n=1 Tax=Jaculus jaculus TaxID=51337 RepID=UPI001E1B50F9|nr:methylcytosine dioxygenase TET1 isoform X2 [Jaculus jaculus]